MKTLNLKPLMLIAAPLLLLNTGCKKTDPPATVVVSAPAATPAPAPAPTPAPAAAPAAPAAAPTPVASANGVMIDATVGSSSSVDWAMKQDTIKHDPQGQWAISATASSSYGDATAHQSYAPWQATGEPNVDKESDNGAAWTSKTADAGIEWLDLSFPRAVSATGLRIRESDGAGSIIKVDLYDEQGTVHPLWSGTDPTTGLNYFILTFPKTDYKTNRVKLTLATNLIPGWNEIDAVQLLSADK